MYLTHPPPYVTACSAPVIDSMATSGHNTIQLLTINISMGHNKLLVQSTYVVVFPVRKLAMTYYTAVIIFSITSTRDYHLEFI